MSGATLRLEDSSSLRWGVSPYAVQTPWLTERKQPALVFIQQLVEQLPPWLLPAVARLVELGNLPTVDPHGSRPLNPEDVRDALTFMFRVMRNDTRVPWIGRLASGGVQLAWQVDNLEVEAVFDRARNERELLVSVGEHEWEESADAADTLFGSVVDRLGESYVEQASAPRAEPSNRQRDNGLSADPHAPVRRGQRGVGVSKRRVRQRVT